jgi:uncharacterized membrane protein YgaE (UPF0421/DUF939 family)
VTSSVIDDIYFRHRIIDKMYGLGVFFLIPTVLISMKKVQTQRQFALYAAKINEALKKAEQACRLGEDDPDEILAHGVSSRWN